MPFIPLYFIYFIITSFPLLSICSLHSGNWYKNLLGKRSAGKLHAAFDEAGAGNVNMGILD
ncbi:hypothetical protein LOK48_01210 [Wolbachia endosymbiont of Corcyra cephalonica]|uniref:hypothetical protein n=1 Tax=Wolbachia endosymbiont of Corcyra cephalonica TaxID=218111 RepID=UPI001E35708B|nr:hypothetical protein [Wolbachia endosymbiont of Corcyra cephalonica]UFO00595.1 hypothetical protein LOK48_01210 [Wolbachia endosymbiont of Corcyra cephalonica]